VYPVYAAKGAEFLQLQPLGLGLLILGLAIVLAFALGALQSDNFSHRFAPFSCQNSEAGTPTTGFCILLNVPTPAGCKNSEARIQKPE
jgi:hypothetical protein